MTNDLKNFLKVENRKEGVCYSKLATRPLFYTDTIKGEQVLRDDMWAVSTEELHDHDTRLINFVLSLVEKEVENLKCDNRYDLQHCKESNQDYFHGAGNSLNDISTIIKQLRV